MHRPTITILGSVPRYSGTEFLMPADNHVEVLKWLQEEGVTTRFSRRDNRPAIKIRDYFASFCRPGMRVGQTVEVVPMKNGRKGIRAVSLTIFLRDRT